MSKARGKRGRACISTLFLIGLIAITSACKAGGEDPLNAVYRIDEAEIRLRDGRFEIPAAPGSAALLSAVVFDTPVFGDLDGDGIPDAALILVYQAGGSGTFYYLAAALKRENGFRGTNAILLGDRIKPRAVRIHEGTITAEFLDRGAGEPMASAPTIAASRTAVVDGDGLVELKLTR